MESLGFVKTRRYGAVEILVSKGRYYYWSRGRKFPIKKSEVEQGEPV